MKFGKMLAVWTAVLFLAGMFAPAVYGESGVPVSMEASCGYEGKVRSGRYMPVNFSLKSETDAPFEGTVRVCAMESDFGIYEYDYPVSLPALGSLEESLSIPAGRAAVLYVKLLDSQENELLSRKLNMNIAADIAELYVGILSDQPEKLSYMDGVGVNYSAVRIKTFDMGKAKMPDKVIGLDPLDVLLITDYDTKSLSEEQALAVWEWVDGGGTLLLGTGARADDTLSAFSSRLLEGPYETPRTKEVDMGVEYALEGPGDSSIELVCADLSLKKGVEVLLSDEIPVLTCVSSGKGRVGAAAYDFGDIEDFCTENRSYVDKLFTALLGESGLNDISSNAYNGSSPQFWSVQTMLNAGNLRRLPNLFLYTAVILCYLGLIGPGAYLFLRKKGKRVLYRFAVTGLSLFFTALIYLLGIGTRYRDTFFTYATILDTTENWVNEYTYINMRTPYHKSYSVSLDPSYDILPITRSDSYEMGAVPEFTGAESYQVRIGRREADTLISVQEGTAFTPQYYSLRKKFPNQERAGIVSDITLFNGKVSGSITNRYAFPLEKVGILMFGKMVLLEELEAGQTMELDGLPVINYPIGNFYLISAKVAGSSGYGGVDIESPDYTKALYRSGLLNFYLEKYFSFYNPEARIVAFGKEQISGRFLTGEELETSGMTMFTSLVEVKTEKGERSYRPALRKPPVAVSGQYYSDTNSIYGADPVSLEYFLGNDLEVETLSFESPSEEFLNPDSLYYTNMFNGNLYFYNHDTGNYDRMNQGKTTYKSWELDSYLSPGNTLIVRYVLNNTPENNWYGTLPMLVVEGRNK